MTVGLAQGHFAYIAHHTHQLSDRDHPIVMTYQVRFDQLDDLQASKQHLIQHIFLVSILTLYIPQEIVRHSVDLCSLKPDCPLLSHFLFLAKITHLRGENFPHFLPAILVK